ncbi:hypothetical protein PV327_000675 [Microctonus hyperodae]|uniref:Uncharacterized protein n=1 Tax=Microctonus hyperodae TaxID=165561 RepID=A0AA39L2L7_MICHY|nr:hypothetical protein PV327_000675 [Microctonus hyperodae]
MHVYGCSCLRGSWYNSAQLHWNLSSTRRLAQNGGRAAARDERVGRGERRARCRSRRNDGLSADANPLSPDRCDHSRTTQGQGDVKFSNFNAALKFIGVTLK